MGFYEETNPPDIDESLVLNILRSVFPQIERPQVQFLYHGTYNVYLVENHYIFRFPSIYHPPKRRREYVRREVKLLKLLKSHLGTPIPEPEFIDFELDTPFMGYPMIPGERFSLHYLNASPEQLRGLGEQIGHFAGEFHSIKETVLNSEAGNFTPEVYRSEQSAIFDRVQDEVYPQLSTKQREWTESIFNDFLEPDENFEFEPVITHGDLYTTNILVNPPSISLTGIIDFENVCLYDPAVDFIFLREGADLLKSLLRAYPHRIDPKLGDRVTYIIGKQPFFYFLKGFDFGIDRMVKFGHTRIIDHMKNWDYFLKVREQSFN
ncbi:MAG: aminoglycoside phosphotransferase family protein [Candidatus Thorarchaeota archaeon]|nr:MAG: aminoglycoside phosphotransferase family protein [Candidatus Thorarchaeota archaeon]